jgi:ATP-dependent exoDNAse (exonuclease V) alpha subunit
MKIKEHDCVVLTKNLPEENLEVGDVGTVVHIHKDKDGVAYEVEFRTLDGHTVAVATVGSAQLRPVSHRDISHVRELQAA